MQTILQKNIFVGLATYFLVSAGCSSNSMLEGSYEARQKLPANIRAITGRFETVEQNSIRQTLKNPVSTFSIDVDTASYSFVRRQLHQGILPPPDAVRIEEMVNYFDYEYPAPQNKLAPFNTFISVLDSPWKKGNKLFHIGIKGYDIPFKKRPRANLVFLIDVSGSMDQPDKLLLVRQSMSLLLEKLDSEDTVAIAVYAGTAGTILEPTKVKHMQKILYAINRLKAGGSTAGAAGIKLAYELAEQNFDKNAVNRVILATDGDFNVGITNSESLKSYIERKRDSSIFLSILGFGRNNYNDHLMQELAQHGNGVAAYIDSLNEAQKVLVTEASSTLFPIAKDVKIQVEFNPNTVSEYRLIGYETRMLTQDDFHNDKIDAGDIGSGHKVTALYEITPTQSDSGLIDKSRYVDEKLLDINKDEYAFLKIRYKLPDENTSRLIKMPIKAKNTKKINSEVRFAISVAGFSQLLKGGTYTENWNYDNAIILAENSKGKDPFGYRKEFIELVKKAKVASELKHKESTYNNL